MSYLKIITGLLFVIFLLVFAGCGEVKEIFKDESPHEKYQSMLEKSGMINTELGRSWIDTSRSVLTNPVEIRLPFKEEMYFFKNNVEAHSFKFTGRRGEMVIIGIRQDTDDKYSIFLDLFEVYQDNEVKLKRITSSDSTGIIQQEIEDDGTYLIRIQPELLSGGRVTLTLISSPSLAFPIPGKDSRAIRSIFGDSRDGGKREHHGVDIFAGRGTPITSVSDGIVTRVNNTKIGGKVVWVFNTDKGQNIYYAHMDSQLVKTGTIVRTGDTLGLVGNTGNARFTPPHLHFGIYIPLSGPVDPYPFIDNVKDAPEDVTADTKLLGKYARIKPKSASIKPSLIKNSEPVASLERNTPVEIIGSSGDHYFVRTPSGSKGFIKSSSLESITGPLRTVRLRNSTAVFDSPLTVSEIISYLEPNNSIEVYGKYGEFLFIRNNNYYGWTLDI